MRGNVYGSYAKDFPDRAIVVGVAEPRETRRIAFKNRFSIEDCNVYSDWKEVS